MAWLRAHRLLVVLLCCLVLLAGGFAVANRGDSEVGATYNVAFVSYECPYDSSIHMLKTVHIHDVNWMLVDAPDTRTQEGRLKVLTVDHEKYSGRTLSGVFTSSDGKKYEAIASETLINGAC